jgi:kynureninase
MAPGKFETGIEFASKLDEQDSLKSYRKKFYISEPETIYLDGNSLGRLPEKTRETIRHVTDYQCGTRLIRSWNEGWYEASKDASKKLAPIIGATEEEVIICDSTSINLYKLAFAAVKSQPGKTKIVSDDLNFPTDLYVLQGIVDQLGPDYQLELAQSKDGLTVDPQALVDVIDQNTALVVLSHVTFKSAFMYDMKAVTAIAHQKGALILWDLSHAAGAVPVELNNSNADLAIGCTYKYLNGGPGSPAYLYVKKKLLEQLTSPIWGWFGDKDPFLFDHKYHPADNIRKFLVGTPPILSQEAIINGLDIILSAGIEKIREKSILLSEYFIFLFENVLIPLGFSIGSPRSFKSRGSHISLQHPEAYRICKALINPAEETYKIIPDFRSPDNIRLGITPLYNSFSDIFLTIERLRQIINSKEFETHSSEKDAVT